MAEDPVRLFDESGSELLKSLLSAAREEQPNQAALRRTLTAVGVGSAVIATASTASAATAATTAGAQGVVGAASLGSAKGVASTTLLIVVKWLGAGAIAGIVATSAVYVVSTPTLPAPKAVSAVAVRAPAPAAAAKADSAAGQAEPKAEERAEPAPRAAPAVVAAAPVTSVVAPAPQPLSVPAEVDPSAQLAAELSLLDTARQALAAGSAARALRSLNDYDARFEHPNLAPEALYLRLEALTLQGDKAGTEAVARRLLRSYPSGPHAARARAVLGLDP